MSVQQAQRSTLRNHIEAYKGVLETDEFLTEDLDGTESEQHKAIIVLQKTGAIKSVGRIETEDRDKPVNKWRWAKHRDYLREYLKERDELPCGCRSHIPPERDGEQYVCKFCGDKHDQQQIEAAL